MTLRAKWRRWLVDRAPLPLLTHAHEAFLAVAVFIIGGGLIVGDVRPGSVSSQVPGWINLGWAWALFAGSAFTLWGLFQDRPRMEWAGQMLLGWGSAFYSLALASAVPFSQGGVNVLIFAGLALVSWWRSFKITSIALIQQRLTDAAREAHVRVQERRGRWRAHE